MNTATSRPPIRIGSRDYARLEQLLESPTYRHHPGAEGLRTELERASIDAPEDLPPDVVTMESIVVARDEESGATHRLALSYPHQADADADPVRVSVLAPVGTALLGLRCGDRIAWPGPAGRMLSLRVMQIEFRPDAGAAATR